MHNMFIIECTIWITTHVSCLTWNYISMWGSSCVNPEGNTTIVSDKLHMINTNIHKNLIGKRGCSEDGRIRQGCLQTEHPPCFCCRGSRCHRDKQSICTQEIVPLHPHGWTNLYCASKEAPSRQKRHTLSFIHSSGIMMRSRNKKHT